MAHIWLGLIVLALAFSGCGGRRVVEDEGYPKQAKVRDREEVEVKTGADAAMAQELAQRNVVAAEEALKISDAVLREDRQGSLDPGTLDSVEKVLLKALPQAGKDHHHLLLRNLGILHYHKKEYQKARQELQAANEMNPRDARTHYYLACLFYNQARVLEAKGQHRKARASSKRAQVEIERARQLAPNNSLYRQNLSKLTD